MNVTSPENHVDAGFQKFVSQYPRIKLQIVTTRGGNYIPTIKNYLFTDGVNTMAISCSISSNGNVSCTDGKSTKNYRNSNDFISDIISNVRRNFGF